ncbi:aldo/keto reductase [Candidatus Pelagadaptatus aseana]|uniref:aldo/keto reductase n=1 Tax=Candidatus Pelagadaptatus aseana TaxID=3120508 RepID=UPI003C6FE204
MPLHSHRRPIANTGIEVSPIGLGTVKLGRNQGVKYPTGFELPDDRQALNLIAQARDLGINLIDTAPAYGISEARLGTLLKGQRNDWIICSKVGEEFENAESSFDFSPEHTRFSVERSLKRLNTDVIDMVLVHSDGNDLHIINHCGTLDTLAELKQQGLIRCFGMSTKTIEGGLLAAEKSDCVMVTYNLNHLDEQPVLDYCAQHNKGALIKKALASGHIAIEDGEDPVQKSMNFLFAHPGVSSAIIGTINPNHLSDNIIKAEQALK